VQPAIEGQQDRRVTLRGQGIQRIVHGKVQSGGGGQDLGEQQGVIDDQPDGRRAEYMERSTAVSRAIHAIAHVIAHVIALVDGIPAAIATTPDDDRSEPRLQMIFASAGGQPAARHRR